MHVDGDRDERALRERLDRRLQAAIGQDRRGDAPGEVAQLADRGARLLAGAAHEVGDLGTVVQALLGTAHEHAERDEPRLGAVVEVALDAPQLRRLHVEGAATGPGQLVDALDELALARLGQPIAVHDDRVRPERQREAEDRPCRPERPEARECPHHDEDRADEPGDLGVDEQRLLAGGRAAARVEGERVDRERRSRARTRPTWARTRHRRRRPRRPPRGRPSRMLSAAWSESAMPAPLRRGGAVRVSGTALTRRPCSHPCLVDYLAARASRTIWSTSVGSVRPSDGAGLGVAGDDDRRRRLGDVDALRDALVAADVLDVDHVDGDLAVAAVHGLDGVVGGAIVRAGAIPEEQDDDLLGVHVGEDGGLPVGRLGLGLLLRGRRGGGLLRGRVRRDLGRLALRGRRCPWRASRRSAFSASAVAASVAAVALSVADAAARALSATLAGAVTCSVVDSTARGRRNIIQLAARSTVAARAMSMGRETWATFPRSAVGPED